MNARGRGRPRPRPDRADRPAHGSSGADQPDVAGTDRTGVEGGIGGPRAKRRRYGPQWKMILILTIVWVLLIGKLTLGVVLAGAVIGVLITLVFPLPPVQWAGRLHLLGQLRLSWRLAVDLIVSSVAVAAAAFRSRPPRNAIIRVQLRADSDLYQTLTAELVSLVPGSIVVESLRGRRMVYLHVLGTGAGDASDAADPDGARRAALAAEARVLAAYGSRAELTAMGEAPERRQRDGSGGS